MYSYFFVSDHALHFFALGGPDFVVGPDAPKAERNILGVINKVGTEIGATVMGLLKNNHDATAIIGGRYIHSVNSLPGGVSKSINEDERERLTEISKSSLEAPAKFSLQIFEDVVLKNQAYVDLILSDAFTKTYYMGLVDEDNHTNFYDGKVRVLGGSRWERICQVFTQRVFRCGCGTC